MSSTEPRAFDFTQSPSSSRPLTPDSANTPPANRASRNNPPSMTAANERTRLIASSSKSSDDGRRTPRRNLTMEFDDPADDDRVESGKLDDVDAVTERENPVLKRKQSTTLAVAKKIRQRSRYYIPVIEWLPKYNWSLFSGDCTAGLSLACLLIPQGMSYANGLAKLNPVAGLWSTALPAFVYGMLGTCRQLSIGPEAALSLLIGQMIQDLVYGDPHGLPKHPELEAAAIALVTSFQIGVITFALGLLRLGFLDVVLSKALLRGFITAVGVIIFIEQLIPMLGLEVILSHPIAKESPPTLPLSKLAFVFRHLNLVNKTTAILAFSSLAVLIAARLIKQRIVKRPGGGFVRFIPEILLVVAGTTALTGIFRWDERGVHVLGKISGGSGSPFGPPLEARQWKYFSYTLPTAFVAAIIGIVDSVVAARENGTKYGYAVSANRDLVALGAANISVGILTATGGIPVFGSITRSRLNGLSGARTQMASIITSIVIVLAIFFLLPYLYFLPKAVLAAIITLVVYAILAEAPHDIGFFWRMRAWTDFAQMTGTFFLTLLFSIETGLIVSVVFSLILVIQKSTQTRIKIIGRLPNTDKWVPIDENEGAQEEVPGVLVIRIRESLSFANTGQLKERLRRLELYGMQKSHPSDAPRREAANTIILHMGDVDEIDASAIQILHELTTAYTDKGVGIHFAHLKPAHLASFRVVGIADQLGPTHFHRDLRDAMKEIESEQFGASAVSGYT